MTERSPEPTGSMWEIEYGDDLPDTGSVGDEPVGSPPSAPPAGPATDSREATHVDRRFNVPVTQEGLSLRVGR